MKKILAGLVALGLGLGTYKYLSPSDVTSIQDIVQQVNFIPSHEYSILEKTLMSGYAPVNQTQVTLDNENYYQLARKISDISPTTKNLFEPHYKLDELLLAIMMVESRGVKDSVAERTNATGIMQITPRTAEQCGILDENKNIDTHRIKQMDCAVNELFMAYHHLENSVQEVFANCYQADEVDKLKMQFAISAYNNGMGDVRNAIETFEEEQISCPWLSRLYVRDIDQVVPTVLINSKNLSLGKESREYLPKVERALRHIRLQ